MIFPAARALIGPTTLVVINSLRGGGGTAATTASVLLDFSQEADAYFGGIRTPASLILGASLGALFTNVDAKPNMTPRERSATRLYNTCVFVSYLLSFATLVFATAAGVMIMHNDFNAKATSVYELLMREFEFEFLTVRLSYLCSLVWFVVGITSRILVEYKLLVKERRDEACVVCFGVTAIVTHLWSYINSTLADWQSLHSQVLRLVQIILTRAFKERQPLQIVSLMSAVLACFFYARVSQKTKRKHDDVIL